MRAALAAEFLLQIFREKYKLWSFPEGETVLVRAMKANDGVNV
jgi:hypothetical protein